MDPSFDMNAMRSCTVGVMDGERAGVGGTVGTGDIGTGVDSGSRVVVAVGSDDGVAVCAASFGELQAIANSRAMTTMPATVRVGTEAENFKVDPFSLSAG